MLYMVTFTINIPQMLAYIPYMDPMGNDSVTLWLVKHPQLSISLWGLMVRLPPYIAVTWTSSHLHVGIPGQLRLLSVVLDLCHFLARSRSLFG
jgi:hypothetical protein